MNKKTMFRRLVSMLMVFTMIFSMASVVYAGETEPAEEYDITVVSNDKGTVSVDFEQAAEGTAVTITAAAGENYALTQVAYRTVAEDGTEGSTVEISAVDGVYTFNMPASDVEVGAAFQPADGPLLYNSSNSNRGIIGSRKEDYSIYTANWDAFLHAGDRETDITFSFDKRFLEIEDVCMIVESRQVTDKGYKEVGRVSFDKEELQELAASAVYDGKEYDVETFRIPVMEDKEYEAGLQQYCVVKFGCPDWVDAFGNPIYRWDYTNAYARILEAGADIPDAIVWLYNLDANSYRGSIVRKALEEVNVQSGTINNENLGQKIGYLVDWEGYEPVENPYHSGEYDVEYMLIGNLSGAQLNTLLTVMDKHNIYIPLKSVPTTWTAGKTFVELFEIMAEESEALQEAVALDKMIYTAKALDEATYGETEHWAALQEEIAKALTALATDAEETGEGAALYRNARLALEEIYLLITGKTVLEGDLVLTLTEQEDGTYKVTAHIDGELDNPTFTYNWEPASSSEEAAADHLIVAKKDIYKVSLDITGTGSFYGKMSASLNVPAAPQFSVSAGTNSISVSLKAEDAVLNTPAAEGYVAELYLNGELMQSQEVTSAKSLVFTGLNEGTEYVLKLNSYNIVGRSNIVEEAVKTSSSSYTGSIVTPSVTPSDPEAPAADVNAERKASVDAIQLAARSEMSSARGKKAVKVTWHEEDGDDISILEGYEVFRSVKRYEGYGKKAYFETSREAYWNTAVETGTRYYYKVRGYVTIDGERYYTDLSSKAYRTVR
ncbi:MAG: DUF3783 domain-containing protein [Firmicutes bacterium]|nr:DUF3783 domain-containing protein [Bacillota bacterium]